MIDFLLEYGFVMVTATLCVIAVLVNGMVSHTYTRLLRAATDMGCSEHRLMKNLRTKFEACYKLKIGVPDVPVFVEKYIRHYTVMGIKIASWEAFCKTLMLSSMMLSLSGTICSMLWGFSVRVTYMNLLCGVVGNGVILFFDCCYHIADRRELLRIDIIDFLENLYKPRLENETFHEEMLSDYRQEYFHDDPARENKVVNFSPRETSHRSPVSIEFTKEEEDIIREVIREYMG